MVVTNGWVCLLCGILISSVIPNTYNITTLCCRYFTRRMANTVARMSSGIWGAQRTQRNMLYCMCVCICLGLGSRRRITVWLCVYGDVHRMLLIGVRTDSYRIVIKVPLHKELNIIIIIRYTVSGWSQTQCHIVAISRSILNPFEIFFL